MQKDLKKSSNKQIRAGEFRNIYHKKVGKTKSHPALTTKVSKKSKDKKTINFLSFTHHPTTKLNKKKMINKKLNQNIDPFDPEPCYVIPTIRKAAPGKFSKNTLPFKLTNEIDKAYVRHLKKHKKRSGRSVT